MILFFHRKKNTSKNLFPHQQEPFKESEKLLERFRGAVAALPFSHAQIAWDLNLKSLVHFENLLEAKAALNFRFLKLFCRTYGLCFNSVVLGEGESIYSRNPDNIRIAHTPDGFESLKKVHGVDAIEIYRSDCTESHGIYVFRIGKKFAVGDQFRVGHPVGDGGRAALANLYEAIEEWEKASIAPDLSSWSISPEQFKRLNNGKIHPQSIEGKVDRDWIISFSNLIEDYEKHSSSQRKKDVNSKIREAASIARSALENRGHFKTKKSNHS